MNKMLPVFILLMVALVAADEPLMNLSNPEESDSDSVSRVRCDSTSSCPGTDTCCLTASGSWRCCPKRKAVCCTGGLTCCPKGYYCLTSSQCGKKWLGLPSSSQPASKIQDLEWQTATETV
ncbi:progranulin-like [Pseudorasbora parva]|uniref:progranulin-like n=1 Tax=Pseudorasbora parva TaxID=51549 RepID=UPI00351DDF4B